MKRQHAFLEYVDDRRDIVGSLNTFNAEAPEYPDLAWSLVRSTSFWVYDPVHGRFGPSKFVGFKDMDFETYAAVRNGLWTGDRFHGRRTWKAIERLLGSYGPDPELRPKLVVWAARLLWHGVCNTMDERKWKFVRL